MKYVIRILFIFSGMFSIVACESGYKKESGQWVWVTHDESQGKRITYMDSLDNNSFRVLDNENYGADNNQVYYKGRKIAGADPGKFSVINDDGYGKDSHHVFLECDHVVFADPATFEALTFPYAKDNKHVYCGTLPMPIESKEIADFKVTNLDKLMANTRSTTILSHFIELNPEYAWLDTLKVERVITGQWATAKTGKRKFIGFKEEHNKYRN